MAQAFVAARVVTPEGTRSGAVLVEHGVIARVCGIDELPADIEVLDFGDRTLIPGLVDSHVHINEPGRTEWEGFATATHAAAAGGYTLLVDMPLNCLPETTTVEAVELKRKEAAGKCLVDWAAWGGAVAENQLDLLPLARAGVPGYKCFLIYPGCDGFTMIDREQLERALPAIAESGLPLLVHAELSGPIDAALSKLAGADWRRYSTYLASRPDDAELEAIEMMIGLCRRYRFRLHIVHLSTAQGLALLRSAKADGLPVTVETCPHYLYFAAEEIADGNTLAKCAPPIRSAKNREALWNGLRDGVIDLIATDHSPCLPEMKRLQEGRFRFGLGRNCQLVGGAGGHMDERVESGVCRRRCSAVDGGWPSDARGYGRPRWGDRAGKRREPRSLRSRRRVYCSCGSAAFSTSGLTVCGGSAARSCGGDVPERRTGMAQGGVRFPYARTGTQAMLDTPQ